MKRLIILFCTVAAAIFAAAAAEIAETMPRGYRPNNKQANERFAAKKQEVAALEGSEVDLVMIGDSITHIWDRKERGLAVWNRMTEGKKALNLGFGGDKTQNVIWRLANGELDGYKAKVVTIMIGTNNTKSAPGDVAEGVKKIVAMVREKQPQAKIILHAIFPRGSSPESRHAAARAKNDKTNAILKEWAGKDGNLVWLDLTDKLTDATGWVTKEIFYDELHPTTKGYEIWAAALEPYL